MLTFSDWFGTKRSSVSTEINRKSVIPILLWFGLMRLRKDLPVSGIACPRGRRLRDVLPQSSSFSSSKSFFFLLLKLLLFFFPLSQRQKIEDTKYLKNSIFFLYLFWFGQVPCPRGRRSKVFPVSGTSSFYHLFIISGTVAPCPRGRRHQ